MLLLLSPWFKRAVKRYGHKLKSNLFPIEFVESTQIKYKIKNRNSEENYKNNETDWITSGAHFKHQLVVYLIFFVT